jgi:hypothetical protein
VSINSFVLKSPRPAWSWQAPQARRLSFAAVVVAMPHASALTFPASCQYRSRRAAYFRVYWFFDRRGCAGRTARTPDFNGLRRARFLPRGWYPPPKGGRSTGYFTTFCVGLPSGDAKISTQAPVVRWGRPQRPRSQSGVPPWLRGSCGLQGRGHFFTYGFPALKRPGYFHEVLPGPTKEGSY